MKGVPTKQVAPPAKLLERRDLRRIPVWIGLRLVYALPVPVIFRLARLQGRAAARLSRTRRGTASRLAETLGQTRSPAELRRIARRHYEFLQAESVVDVWPWLRGFAGLDACSIDGLSHLDRALERGNGALLVSAHLGYPRLIKAALRSRGYAVSLVGYTGAGYLLPQQYTRLGFLVHSKLLRLPSRGPKGSNWADIEPGINVRPILQALKRNEAVEMLADGRSAGTMHPVSILGRRIQLTPGLVSLARASGAALLPAFVIDAGDRVGDGFRVEICEPLDVAEPASPGEVLDRFGAILERYVERYPHLWRWSRARFFVVHDRGIGAAWRQEAPRVPSARSR